MKLLTTRRIKMKNKHKFLSAMAIIATSVTTANTAEAHIKAKEGQEKCYGVVKAGKNACGSADGKHMCAGLAKADKDPNEWIILPEGLCEKLTGGSTEPAFKKEDKKG
jgi:uncharacterized membrane protein